MPGSLYFGCLSGEEFIPVVSRDLSSLFGLLAPENTLSGAAKSDARLIEELAALNGTFRL